MPSLQSNEQWTSQVLRERVENLSKKILGEETTTMRKNTQKFSEQGNDFTTENRAEKPNISL